MPNHGNRGVSMKLVEEARRLIREIKEYPREMVEEVLKSMGPGKHLVRYVLEKEAERREEDPVPW